MDVEGDITVTPDRPDGGVGYDANTTLYPSVEAYQITSSGEPQLLVKRDATMSPYGPPVLLPLDRHFQNLHN